MARRRHDRWLLIRLVAQNVGRRRLRAILLGAAVMLGVGIGFASFVAGWALREGMATSYSRMGADLVVVPRATLVNIASSLLTVQPTDETLATDLAERIAAIAGIAQVAPQRIVPALVEGHNVNLIAFDPAHDFSVLTWLEEREAGPLDGLIAGGGLVARLGETLSVCGMPLRTYGRLGKTGVGPFDESYFLSFGALADIVSFCRASDARTGGKPAASAKAEDVPPVVGMNHSDASVCSPDLLPDRASAFLLQLSPGAKVEEVKFGLARLSDIKIVEGNGVLTSSRQALSTLLIGIAVFAAFQLGALLILVSLLFSAIVQERYREVGLLLLVDFGVEKYQEMRLRERAARIAALQHTARNNLRGDVQSVTDLGDGRYELTTYLQNVGGGQPIYVMSPDMRAYVQVRTVWQEVPMKPTEESASGVLKIEGKQTYRYVFDARVRDFAQLLPNYMHVRFSGTMLVSPSSMPKNDVFERKDNYYVYLKPFDIADEVVLRRMRFSGKPPVWIPMPPH